LLGSRCPGGSPARPDEDLRLVPKLFVFAFAVLCMIDGDKKSRTLVRVPIMGFDDRSTIHERDNSPLFIVGKLLHCFRTKTDGILFRRFWLA
jgi:hypothetical protein